MNNNFDSVRIVLALIVVFAHILALTQLNDFNIFELIFNSNFAVKGFFAISGFLVMKSYLNSKNIFEYGEKRFRRIYPAYFIAIILCLCIGLIVTKLNTIDFIKSNDTLKYLFFNLIFLNFIQPTLPSVFTDNPIQALDGSLWTIKIELMLYFCIPLLVFFFNRFGSLKTSIFVYFLSIFWTYYFINIYSGVKGEEIARQFPGQIAYFTIGSLYFENKKIFNKLKLISLISLLTIFITNNSFIRLFVDPIAYSSIVIFLANSNYKNIKIGKYGDISYGIYLYHFPIIQLIIFSGLFKLNAWIGLFSVFLLTITMSLLSWHIVEKKLLKRSSHYVAFAKG